MLPLHYQQLKVEIATLSCSDQTSIDLYVKILRNIVKTLFSLFVCHKTSTSYSFNRIELETNNLPRGNNDSFWLNGRCVYIPISIYVSWKCELCKSIPIALNIVYCIFYLFWDASLESRDIIQSSCFSNIYVVGDLFYLRTWYLFFSI